jgi:hypothetical protein
VNRALTGAMILWAICEFGDGEPEEEGYSLCDFSCNFHLLLGVDHLAFTFRPRFSTITNGREQVSLLLLIGTFLNSSI